MYRVFSGANGEYVAFMDADGFHLAPLPWSREANQGWDQTERLQAEATRLNVDSLADEHEDAMYEECGEAAYGLED